ncbi:MAG: S-adenosylmethionine decarboxylase [Chloroflexi bacterium]|nr:S-adenosylmethionine decarboxylase [Chloroflexota bacterium]
MHLIIDGYEADVAKLENEEFVYQFLDDCPEAIGMTKITSPHVYVYQGPKPEDDGLSGFVLIAESHISVHTFPRRRYVNIDVFSCKEFDAQRALREIRETFSLGKVRSWVLERGLEYADVAVATRAVEMERARLFTAT